MGEEVAACHIAIKIGCRNRLHPDQDGGEGEGQQHYEAFKQLALSLLRMVARSQACQRGRCRSRQHKELADEERKNRQNEACGSEWAVASDATHIVDGIAASAG